MPACSTNCFLELCLGYFESLFPGLFNDTSVVFVAFVSQILAYLNPPWNDSLAGGVSCIVYILDHFKDKLATILTQKCELHCRLAHDSFRESGKVNPLGQQFVDVCLSRRSLGIQLQSFWAQI